MNRLNLLFTKDGLQYQIARGKTILEDYHYFLDETLTADDLDKKLDQALSSADLSSVTVLSAINHFTMMPEGFQNHESGYDLIGYNAPTQSDSEELMLSVNRKYRLQFYYSFPKDYYQRIKALNLPTQFNFSGEKFLTTIQPKFEKEIHINLYHNQCEFFAIQDKKVILYNNLDVDSEVDFLYFIMFTLSKIDFGINDTRFFAYGETTENETFISELGKFVKHLKINFDNAPKSNFIMS